MKELAHTHNTTQHKKNVSINKTNLLNLQLFMCVCFFGFVCFYKNDEIENVINIYEYIVRQEQFTTFL
jgi:hypothetical protein